MESQLKGGIISGLKRAVTGESIFLTRFPRAMKRVLCHLPGRSGRLFTVTIAPGKEFIAQKNSFLACEETVELDIAFTDKIRAALWW